MAKISFGKTVKYQGSIYPPNTVFEVLDEEVEDLQKAGGWIKEEPENEEVEDEKSELDILKEKADKLGIEYKGNWGIKKLKEAIEEAEA